MDQDFLLSLRISFGNLMGTERRSAVAAASFVCRKNVREFASARRRRDRLSRRQVRPPYRWLSFERVFIAVKDVMEYSKWRSNGIDGSRVTTLVQPPVMTAVIIHRDGDPWIVIRLVRPWNR